ncbi:uncharacterized protein A1O9_03057 [Exophiala aquamarina CBS 119918]|uniref:NmrA-like domain-containing protein n=1 Tax=Exophiala aquamarina CBS 119918 TaxID=1182545 RepID=A0A072Q0S0_9EURO|nr:uncharacterized protein A1O9_03057 [Exophiala aquamarina CBS 119918]KEF61490.1 hypothetical protein A1O9_03057 [Exophiala aquamarina CBS 119918]
MLVLTGTTGHLGSRVLDALLDLKLIPPSELIISSNSPDKVSSRAKDARIEIRKGDFTSSESLVSSFQGADALFLVSFPSPAVDRWLHHKRAIEAAKLSGVKTIIYTSLMFGGETGLQSVAGVQQAHIKTIEYLSQCGIPYVIIREGIYTESWWLYAGYQSQKFAKGDQSSLRFVIPNDGPVAWVSWDDLGEGTARILADYQQYIGQTLRLTGPQVVTISGIASLVEKYAGRKVDVQVVGKEKAARYHKFEKKSLPEESFWVIESWAGWHDGLAQGEASVVDPLLETLLGRKPRGIEDVAGALFTPS